LHEASKWAAEQLHAMEDACCEDPSLQGQGQGEYPPDLEMPVDELSLIEDKKEVHKIMFASALITSGIAHCTTRCLLYYVLALL
jgi:hypothetical protein